MHQGSAVEDVVAAYGDSSIKSNYGGLTLYEYDIAGKGNLNNRVRFAINGQNKVEYISIREVTKNSNSQVTYTFDPSETERAARDVLIRFHRYITAHQLREAYNCLSPAFQSKVGFEGWARGFDTTVESRVENITASKVEMDTVTLNYILVARDNPSGTRRFRGTTTLKRTDNGFKLNEIVNKNM